MINRKKILYLIILVALFWGVGRLYYAVTDGFTERNITYDLPYEVRREVAQLPPDQQAAVNRILDQKFTYIAKGCQSYVFESEDGQYILKFFKFQRYRPQEWLDHFAWIPPVEKHRISRYNHKRKKLDKLFASWKVAFEDLPDETGLLYVKLNSTGDLNKRLTFYDKMGLEHSVDLDEMQFLIQYKAHMLCPTLETMLANNDRQGARLLVTKLIDLFLFEYERGYADFDPAIMQNTGVIHGEPIHVDVGQITHTDAIFNEDVWKQDLFNKTFKFRKWLHQQDAELAEELDDRLEGIIGERFHEMMLTTGRP